MPDVPRPESLCDSLIRLAGYLNFSSGSRDPKIDLLWNEVFDHASQGDPLTGPAAWLVLKDWIGLTLDELSESNTAFADTTQARTIARLLLSELLPAYMDYHRDLLFHQEPEVLFNGFFLARAAEAVLQFYAEDDSGGMDAEEDNPLADALVERAILWLNDFVGYRPVAMLENRRCQPYPHEFVRPIPLYVRHVGVSAGSYCELITRVIAILEETDEDILRAASFNIEQLAELALDPRAYDFDHPVNRRPNYHFGGWDERSVNADGYYSRFVLRQVTLDALLSRVNDGDLLSRTGLDRQELLEEAATVLAGTILMASGVSGSGPAAYSSEVTLGTLMKPIAEYRDAFYLDRLDKLKGEHHARLMDEQQIRRQPFGAARQHLNAALAERRAAQVQHVQLARLYARMGYPDAATRQIDVVPAASARMICRIDCEITFGLRSLRDGKLDLAIEVAPRVFDLLRRAIHCGALADPWDLIGFGGQFSLHPSPECSVHDSRVDDLLYLIDQLFSYLARVWSEAAARNDVAAYDTISRLYRDVAEWWRQFGAHTVESLEAADPLDSYESARLVARALRVWHEGGAAAGDVAFWKPHAEFFDSPRAYSLVISALLERNDFLPSMALLIHWLCNAGTIGLRQGGNSLPRLAERWLMKLRGQRPADPWQEQFEEDFPHSLDGNGGADQEIDVWSLTRKCFDFFEANAEDFWSAPTFLLGEEGNGIAPTESDDVPFGKEEPKENPYKLDEITFKGSSEDGIDGSVFEPGSDTSREELEIEWKRLVDRIAFLQSLARMWSVAADIVATDPAGDDPQRAREQLVALRGWAERAKVNRVGLLDLLEAVRSYKISCGGSDNASMRDYDRSRVLRDSLMERIIGTAVEMSDARRLICGTIIAHLRRHPSLQDGTGANAEAVAGLDEMFQDDLQAVRLYASLIVGDAEETRSLFPEYVNAISDENLLYIPLSRGGDPEKIFVARLRQRVLRHLMHWLPRRGLISEACRLIEVSRRMEQQNSVGIGAVTEFDGLFRDGFRALVEALTAAVVSDQSGDQSPTDDAAVAESLIPLVERLTETMLGSWLEHSQTLRLSPLESVNDPKKWQRLVEFIRRYGDPIFTQVFLQLSNVRAILHQGVTDWLQRVIDEDDPQIAEMQLFEDLKSGHLEMNQADRWITLVYESLIDHHAEYQDYNSTTTQSDRGDLVYMFMDFLRLRASYERIAWNLKPVMWAHEVLVRSGLEKAAIMWRRSLSDRIGTEADKFVMRLREMQRSYSMRMPTVADRILERFVQPMTIARMRALVPPAMRDAEAGRWSTRFEMLEDEAEILSRTPTGVGLDVPSWLAALEEEVEQLAKRKASSEIDPEALMTIPMVPLDLDSLNEQLDIAQSQGRRLPHLRGGKDDD
ncbi:hypothetical protein FYK55_05635 [Roseiconus nitratireducens]|uniref:Uncharacterized protein n=1 Tax=Roseiconus nitratireducens TaxID=2605748 RepID=A0A5M6DIR0_9BACT|nr:hypothetical protein [Roseiconus nitratireducens]KAA5545155.1 hypothetical protein FYK55_05635 [Roseiconus nitratireducens]